MLWKILKVFVLFEIFNTLRMSDDLADMYKDDCYDIDLYGDLDYYDDFYDNFYYDDDFDNDFDDYDVDAEIDKDIAEFDAEWDAVFNNDDMDDIDDFDEFDEASDDDDFVDIGGGKLLKLEPF